MRCTRNLWRFLSVLVFSCGIFQCDDDTKGLTNNLLGPKPNTGWEMIARMGTGINLGNVFDAPGGETTWRREPAAEWEMEVIRNAGFRHVRLPVTWGAHFGNESPYAIDLKFMERIAQVVKWATDRNLIVVLNAMHEEWFKKDPVGQAARFDALWRQIASRFKAVPNELLVFEVLNESEKEHISDEQTNVMNQRILRIIRESNPTRGVIIGAVGDNAGRLREGRLKVPEDPYIIATFHSYDPWSFCSAQVKTWGTETDRQYLMNHEPNFVALKKWSETNKCPLYLGEFGTSGKVDPAARLSYYRFYAQQAALLGFCLAVWDDGGDMKILDRQTREWVPGMINALGLSPADGVR
jgi:endoglucanase